ncbi:MAG TPA: hypothetical protein H9830_07695 [Candidatus Agrococcus pullicola]|uniref:histidine kinase n=1 Tax=Candidatus Agrococcus pullicola TaxID=2838429 RepID=A0A9D1YUN8_9MICO|nr:hypothetical protein [Candidatus Agrococcus pullicola]
MNATATQAQTETRVGSTKRVDDGSTIWHVVVLVLAPATSAVAVWEFATSVPEQPLRGIDWAQSTAGIALPLLIVGAWLLARPRIDRTAVHTALMAFATLCAFGMTWSNPGLTGALSFIMPLTWLASPDAKRAIIWTVTIMVSAAVGLLAGGVFDPMSVVFTAVFIIALSCGIGLSIQKLEQQVHARQRLLEELQQSQDEVALLSAESAATRERASVLRDVHDAVTQNLTAIVMQSRLPAPDAALIEELADEALEETRALLLKATPRQLEDGVVTAIMRLAERFERETGIAVELDVRQVPQSLESEIVLLRAAQEALGNIRKHAQASNVRVSLSNASDGTTLCIADDGIGYDADRIPPGRGLQGVSERVAESSGEFTISGPSGTTFTVTLPVRGNA